MLGLPRDHPAEIGASTFHDAAVARAAFGFAWRGRTSPTTRGRRAADLRPRALRRVAVEEGRLTPRARRGRHRSPRAVDNAAHRAWTAAESAAPRPRGRSRT